MGFHIVVLEAQVPLARIYIHIGPARTGTTSFQRVLKRNRAALEELGIHCPHSAQAEHLEVPLAFSISHMEGTTDRVWQGRGISNLDARITTSQRYRERLEKQLGQIKNGGTYVISSEHLPVMLSAAGLHELVDFLGTFADEIHLIAVVRAYEELVVSAISTMIRWDYATEIPTQLDVAAISYRQLLTPWLDLLGAERLHAIPYADDDDPPPSDVVHRLLTAVGVSLPLPHDAERDANVSLRTKSLGIMKHLNRTLVGFPDGFSRNVLRERLAAAAATWDSSERPCLGVSSAKAVRSSRQEDAEWLASTLGVSPPPLPALPSADRLEGSWNDKDLGEVLVLAFEPVAPAQPDDG